jgi:hypothetical protein
MPNFTAADPAYKHRNEYFANLIKKLIPARNLTQLIYDPMGSEGEYYRQLNLGNIPDPNFILRSSVPTAAAGANAGTSPPAPVIVAGSTDSRGAVTYGTGTSPAAGNEVVVTFGVPYASQPFVILQSQNAATETLQPYVTSVSTTGFTIGFVSAPAASQANTVYSSAFRAY